MFVLFLPNNTTQKNLPKKQQNKENILSLRYLSKPTEKSFVPLVFLFIPRAVVAAFFACKMHLAIALRFENSLEKNTERKKQF